MPIVLKDTYTHFPFRLRSPRPVYRIHPQPGTAQPKVYNIYTKHQDQESHLMPFPHQSTCAMSMHVSQLHQVQTPTNQASDPNSLPQTRLLSPYLPRAEPRPRFPSLTTPTSEDLLFPPPLCVCASATVLRPHRTSLSHD